jgi:uncharacterized protein (TIGR02001 family)
MHKRLLLTTAIVATGALPAVSNAELTANVGWVSDYIFRGFYQEDSSPFGGVDYAHESGFYAGIWGADVGKGATGDNGGGLEYDLYFGYSGSFGESGGFTVGWTGYYYTEDKLSEPTVFDDEYTEINLGISYGIFSIDYADGEAGGFGSSSDYTFTSVAISPEKGPYYSYNTWGDQSAGDFIEIGYGWSGMDLDFSVAFLYDLNAGDLDSVALDPNWYGTDDMAFTFGVSKTFTLSD